MNKLPRVQPQVKWHQVEWNQQSILIQDVPNEISDVGWNEQSTLSRMGRVKHPM